MNKISQQQQNADSWGQYYKGGDPYATRNQQSNRQQQIPDSRQPNRNGYNVDQQSRPRQDQLVRTPVQTDSQGQSNQRGGLDQGRISVIFRDIFHKAIIFRCERQAATRRPRSQRSCEQRTSSGIYFGPKIGFLRWYQWIRKSVVGHRYARIGNRNFGDAAAIFVVSTAKAAAASSTRQSVRHRGRWVFG